MSDTASARSALALSAAPVLAEVVRDGFTESVHRAIACVTAPDGQLDQQWGDAQAPCFPRSANKPMQAVAMLRAGAPLQGGSLALSSASHWGEDFHVAGVRQMLTGAGLAESDLQNTPDLPYGEQARIEWIRSGRDKASVAQNCSGKHAGMLIACQAAGWDLATYRDPAHPLQQLMAVTVEEFAGEPVSALAVDGCGAPVMAISPRGLAQAFGRVAAAAEGTPEALLRDAIRAHPTYIGGTGSDDSLLIAAVPGVIAKAGAEAVYGVGLPDGRGIAVKVADGSHRARTVVMRAILTRLGIQLPPDWGREIVLGHGEPVGEVLATGI